MEHSLDAIPRSECEESRSGFVLLWPRHPAYVGWFLFFFEMRKSRNRHKVFMSMNYSSTRSIEICVTAGLDLLQF